MTVSTQVPPPPYKIDESVIDKLDPEYVKFFNATLADKSKILYTYLFPVDELRAAGNVIPGQGDLLSVGETKDITIPRPQNSESGADAPDIPARVFVPNGTAPENGWPCLLWFHGGGWVLGSLDTENSYCSRICEWSQCVVISVGYRMAPDDPFPACIHDSYDALLWVYENYKSLNINQSKIATGGSSAGGNISAVLSHKFAADKVTVGLPPLVYQLLIVPVCDNTADVDTHQSWKDFEFTPQLPKAKMMWYRHHYLPNEKDWVHPEASPIFYPAESFKNVPPAFIALGQCDILRTEGEIYGAKLKEAGVPTEISIYSGMPHTVMTMDGVLAQGKQLGKETTDALKKIFYN